MSRKRSAPSPQFYSVTIDYRETKSWDGTVQAGSEAEAAFKAGLEFYQANQEVLNQEDVEVVSVKIVLGG